MRQIDRHRRDEALRAANRSRRGLRLLPWRRRRGSAAAGGWLSVLPTALLLGLMLRLLAGEAFRIGSSSMEDTLLAGDFLLVNTWAYGAEIPFTGRRLPALRPPRHDEVIVFDWPGRPDQAFVKRLVGLPGDTLQMRTGVLRRNGRPVSEPYTRRERVGPALESWGPLVVPPFHVFVLGDNRARSLDSRVRGVVPDSLLHGTPWLVYYSLAPDSTAAAPWFTRIRWGRLGTTVR